MGHVAEREGFEPSVELSPHTRLAGERLQPARPSLLEPPITKLIKPLVTITHAWNGRGNVRIDFPRPLSILAEGVGFEPTFRFRKTVFKTAALNHSAIPPGTDRHKIVQPTLSNYQFTTCPSSNTRLPSSPLKARSVSHKPGPLSGANPSEVDSLLIILLSLTGCQSHTDGHNPDMSR